MEISCKVKLYESQIYVNKILVYSKDSVKNKNQTKKKKAEKKKEEKITLYLIEGIPKTGRNT